MRLHSVAILSALLLAALACSREEQDAASGPAPDEQALNLSLALSNRTETKADATVLTELSNTESVNNFRGMDNIRVIPFSRSGAVQSGDVALSHIRSLPAVSSSVDEKAYDHYTWHSGLIRNIRAHLFPNAYAALPEGTASLLVYANAVRETRSSEQADKHLNGSLIESGFVRENAHCPVADIAFSPEPIFTGEVSPLATRLADLLTHIVAAATYTQVYYYYMNGAWHEGRIAVTWNESIAEQSLRQYYRWITGDGELMTGAGLSTEYLVSTLYGRFKRFSSDDEEPFLHTAGGVQYEAVLTEGGDDTFTYATLYNGLARIVIDRIETLTEQGALRFYADGSVRFTDDDLRNYPSSLGLPAGAAVLRWNGLRYVVVTEGLDGIAAMDNYCYMPPLYYYVNSTISTSTAQDVSPVLTSDTASWDQVLSTFRQGKTVRTTTHSVALDRPLQFATGMLLATVRASAPYLPDNDDDPRTNCSVTGTNFPVTGLLLGGQQRQHYDFTPDADAPEYFLYDNQIAGVYLTTTESHDFRTLVFPTPADKDILFFLELRNDSGAAFSGAEGLILPGNYFYLAGKLEMPDNPATPSIFLADYCTTARCVVSSLENAHVAVPEMGQAQLVMGVQTTLNWVMSASSYVVLD